MMMFSFCQLASVHGLVMLDYEVIFNSGVDL